MEKKHLIFCGNGSFRQILPIIETSSDFRIICTDGSIHEILLSKGIDHKLISDYQLDYDVDSKALNWFKEWSSTSLLKSKSIKEIFLYEGVSLWWFMELSLFQQFTELKYSVSVKGLIEQIDLIKKIIKTESPYKITLIGSDYYFDQVVIDVCSSMNLDISHISDKKVYSKQQLVNLLMPIGLKLFVSFRHASRKLISGMFKSGGNSTSNNGSKILVISYTLNWRNNNDVMFSSLIDELTKNGNNDITQIDFPTSSMIGIQRIIEKKKSTCNVLHKLVEEYSPQMNAKNIRQRINDIRENYSRIKHIPIYYEGLDIGPYFFKNMRFLLCYYGIYDYIYYVESIKKAISQEKPDAIVLIDEYNPIGRAAVVAGKLCNIPTIAMQHGIFGSSSLGYFHKSNEISKTNEYHSPYYPLPDITAVFGPYYKKLLLENGKYPESRVAVTGSPRYDIFRDMKGKFHREDLFKKLNLDTGKKLVVYTSQPLDEKENDRILLTILKSMSYFPEAQLLIKMHPRELDVNKDILSRFDSLDVAITKLTSIYEVLDACDVMITSFSTTGLEAMIMGKPVITINLTGKPDKIPYCVSGATMGAYDEKSLTYAIKNLLENNSVKEELLLKSKEFVYDHAYRIDGMASVRIAKLVNSIVQKGNSERV